MRKAIYISVIVLCMIIYSCFRTNRTTEYAEAKIKNWNMLYDSISYSGVIDEKNKIIHVQGLADPNSIMGVSFKLSPGSRMKHNLDSISWKQTQTLTVTNNDVVSIYTLIISH